MRKLRAKGVMYLVQSHIMNVFIDLDRLFYGKKLTLKSKQFSTVKFYCAYCVYPHSYYRFSVSEWGGSAPYSY